MNGRNRIPDELDVENGTLTEVKNTNNLSYTRQLRDFTDYAKENDMQFILMVRGPGHARPTKLTGPLQDAIDNGDITLKYIE